MHNCPLDNVHIQCAQLFNRRVTLTHSSEGTNRNTARAQRPTHKHIHTHTHIDTYTNTRTYTYTAANTTSSTHGRSQFQKHNTSPHSILQSNTATTSDGTTATVAMGEIDATSDVRGRDDTKSSEIHMKTSSSRLKSTCWTPEYPRKADTNDRDCSSTRRLSRTELNQQQPCTAGYKYRNELFR